MKPGLVIFSSLMLINSASAETFTYMVKQYDSIGAILYRLNLKPIYGKRGFLKKVIALNPNIKNINLIRPKSVLLLPTEELACSEPKSVPVLSRSVSNQSFFGKSLVSFSLTPYYSLIESVDLRNSSTSTLVSKINQNYKLNWTQVLSENYSTFAEWNLNKESYANGESTSLPIYNNASSLFAMKLGALFSPTTKDEFNLSLGVEEQVFAVGRSGSAGVELKTLQGQNLSFSYFRKVMELNPFSYYLGFGVQYNLGAHDDVLQTQAAQAYSLLIGLDQKMHWGNIKLDSWYKQIEQKSNILRYKKSEIGLGVGFRFAIPSIDKERL